MRHLARHQQVDLAPVVLVVCEALVHLGLGEVRKTASDETVYGLTVLKEANHVVHAYPRALDARVAAVRSADTWGRVAFKEQVGNRSWQGSLTPYVGVEFIGQGNEDIRSQQYGGFVEFTHVPSAVSVMLRAGYKRSSFDTVDDRTGPYFGVNFYKRVGR